MGVVLGWEASLWHQILLVYERFRSDICVTSTSKIKEDEDGKDKNRHDAYDDA